MHFKHAKNATGVFFVTSTPKRVQNDRLGPGYTLEPVKNRQNVGGWWWRCVFINNLLFRLFFLHRPAIYWLKSSWGVPKDGPRVDMVGQ